MSRNGTRKRHAGLVLPKEPAVSGQRELTNRPWGILWIASLESSRGRDSGQAARLDRALSYARRGAVGDITVRAGELSARVTGSGRSPYRVTLRVPELPRAEWDRLIEAWSDDVDAAAELFRGELGEATARIAAFEDIALVPRPGLTDYECTCPDWGFPCKHAAAVSYQYARAIDARPDALLLLHGHLLGSVREEAALRCAEREAAPAEQAAQEVELTRACTTRAVPAGEAFARAGQDGGLPPLPQLPAPETASALADAVGPFPDPGHEDSLVHPDRLRTLADDAAHRAAAAYRHALAAGGTPAAQLWLDSDSWLDTVRRAARADGDPRVVGRLLNNSDQARAGLARASVAWRYGGEPALAVLDGGHVPPRAAETAARERLLTTPLPGLSRPPSLRRTGGRLQLVGHEIELRYGPDGLWYPFRKKSGQWWAAGRPSPDAVEAVLPILAGS